MPLLSDHMQRHTHTQSHCQQKPVNNDVFYDFLTTEAEANEHRAAVVLAIQVLRVPEMPEFFIPRKTTGLVNGVKR